MMSRYKTLSWPGPRSSSHGPGRRHDRTGARSLRAPVPCSSPQSSHASCHSLQPYSISFLWLPEQEGRRGHPPLQTLVNRAPCLSVIVAAKGPRIGTDVEDAASGFDQHLSCHTGESFIQWNPQPSLIRRFEDALTGRHEEPATGEQNPANRVVRQCAADRPPGHAAIGAAKDPAIEGSGVDASLRIDGQHTNEIFD